MAAITPSTPSVNSASLNIVMCAPFSAELSGQQIRCRPLPGFDRCES